jgi:hypothetical protein
MEVDQGSPVGRSPERCRVRGLLSACTVIGFFVALLRKGGSPMCRNLAFTPWLPLAAALFCVSCSGNKLNTVQGKVLYQGQAAKGAQVVFHPKGKDDLLTIRPTGITGEDGTFTLTSGKDAGAPAGEYVVTIIWPEEPPAAKNAPKITMEGPPTPPDRLKGRYANREASTFTAVIKSGANQLEPFDLR